MLELRTNTRRFTIKDDKEEQYFDTLVNHLLNVAKNTDSAVVSTEKQGIPSETPPMKATAVMKETTPPKKVQKERGTAGENEKFKVSRLNGLRLNGLLHVSCEHCGKANILFTKEPISVCECRFCGKENELHEQNFRMAFANCECGADIYYKTNSPEPEFDIECKECKSPVALQWNSKKKCYETMK